MASFSQMEINNAHLGMYVGTRGPKILRKRITDKLFTYQILRNEEAIREKFDADMDQLVFLPDGSPISSPDDLDDLVLPDICTIAFSLPEYDPNQTTLRIEMKTQLEGPIFCKFMENRRKQLEKKNSRLKLLSRVQFAKLYPEKGKVDLNKLDITLLCFILFEGFGLKPITDYDKLPKDSVISTADDILRIKICRNFIVHNDEASISDDDFHKYWECLTGAFERLSGNHNYRLDSDKLKSLRLPDDKIMQYQLMIEDWRRQDKEEQVQYLTNVKECIITERLHTEDFVKATGEKLLKNQNENHDQVVKLIRQSHSDRRKVQRKSAKCMRKSFPLQVYGFDKYKKVCHMMQENNIKYSIPNGSSTDTSSTSESSGGQKSSEFEIDSEEISDKLSPKVRRSSSLPNYRRRRPRTQDSRETTINNTGLNVDNVSQTDTVGPDSSVDFDFLEKSSTKESPKDSIRETTDTCNDPTGYFLSLRKRDEFNRRRENKEEKIETQTFEGYFNDTYQTSRPRDFQIQQAEDVFLDEVDIHSLSSTSGEYFLEDKEITSFHKVSSLQSSLQSQSSRATEILPSFRSEAYSDSTGYNTDLIELNSSVDTVTLFRPVQLPQPTCAQTVCHVTPQMLAISRQKERDRVQFCSSVGPEQLDAKIADDGYSSNGYFSSLDRTTMREGHHVQIQKDDGFIKSDSDTEEKIQEENLPADKTDTKVLIDPQSSISMNTIENENSGVPISQRRSPKQNSSFPKWLRACFLCGVKTRDTEMSKKDVNEDVRLLPLRRETAEETDVTAEEKDFVRRFSELQEKKYNNDNSTTDSSDELNEIFV